MHLYEVIIRNDVIDDPDTTYSFGELDTLDTCKEEGLFRQVGSNECLEYCPTGCTEQSGPSVCSEAPDAELSTAVFTLFSSFPIEWIDNSSKGKY
jgi:hypothetical protein